MWRLWSVGTGQRSGGERLQIKAGQRHSGAGQHCQCQDWARKQNSQRNHVPTTCRTANVTPVIVVRVGLTVLDYSVGEDVGASQRHGQRQFRTVCIASPNGHRSRFLPRFDIALSVAALRLSHGTRKRLTIFVFYRYRDVLRLLRPLPFAPVLLVSIVRWGNFVCNCHDVDTLRLASTWKLSRKGLPSRAWRAKQQTCCLERRSSKLEKGRFQSEPPRGCPWLV